MSIDVVTNVPAGPEVIEADKFRRVLAAVGVDGGLGVWVEIRPDARHRWKVDPEAGVSLGSDAAGRLRVLLARAGKVGT